MPLQGEFYDACAKEIRLGAGVFTVDDIAQKRNAQSVFPGPWEYCFEEDHAVGDREQELRGCDQDKGRLTKECSEAVCSAVASESFGADSIGQVHYEETGCL